MGGAKIRFDDYVQINSGTVDSVGSGQSGGGMTGGIPNNAPLLGSVNGQLVIVNVDPATLQIVDYVLYGIDPTNTRPIVFHGFVPGPLIANQTLFTFDVVEGEECTFPANLSGSIIAVDTVAAENAFTLLIKQNGETVGSILYNTGQQPVATSGGFSFAGEDRIDIVAGSTISATAAGFRFAFRGTPL